MTTTISVSSFAELGYVQLSWDQDLTGGRTQFNVKRTDVETSVEETIYTGTVKSYQDHWARSDAYYLYKVTQDGGGQSEIIDYQAQVYLTTDYYWLVHPTDSTYNIRLYSVNQESFVDDYEELSVNLIGRGRHVEFGTEFGFVGSLTSKLYDETGKTAREKRQELEAIKNLRTWVWLRNPFGDFFKIAIGKISFTRVAGRGHSEDLDITIPYQQVA